MKRASLTALMILLFGALMGRGAQPLEVTSLDLGGCWVHQERFEDPLWKVASFSDSAAFTILASQFQQTLNGPISAELQRVFSNFQPSATETYFHCSAAGHFFWTSIHDGKVPLCVWSKMTRDRDTGSLVLSLLDVFPDHDFKPSGPCSGATRKSLIVVISPDSDIDAITAYLRTDARYAGVIAQLSPIGRTIIILKLTDPYDFRENVVKALIESDDLLAGDLRAVQYDGRVATVGENLRLFSGNYPGF